MTSTPTAVAGCVIFALLWVLLLRERWPALPLGRTAGTVVAASLFVTFGVLSPEEAFDAVNVPTLGLLFGCMLVCAHAEALGLYARLATLLGGSASSPHAFLLRLSFVSGLSSALVTNDTAVIILTPIVIAACRARGLRAEPFLIALATSANIGSACSPIGNPQNAIIASLSGVLFTQFLGAIGLVTVLALCANAAVIALVYRGGQLVVGQGPSTSGVTTVAGVVTASTPLAEAAAAAGPPPAAAAAAGPPPAAAAAASSETASLTCNDALSVLPAASASAVSGSAATPVTPPPSPPSPSPLRRRLALAFLCVLPLLFLFADRWVGLSWCALFAASLLCVIDGRPPEPLLARVNGSLLLFFAALFIATTGFSATGVPDALWRSVEGGVALGSISGVWAFTALVALGSNTVSNVPLVLLLAPKLSSFSGADAVVAWLVLAFSSTVSGNATLFGSVANLIVSELAASEGEAMPFGAYARVGLPSTLLSLSVGTPIVWALAKSVA